ncbi:hypothetical protein HC891_22020, partial [Candidatus Gracilibacteria bacterium]|nr:hypothetical protein [Candidatus Gracilibacteria bacterium]
MSALDTAGNESAQSSGALALPDTTTPANLNVPLRINFQNNAATVPAGYIKDHGQPFANVRGFGWVLPGSSTPLDLAVGGTTPGNGRDRGESASGLDQRLDTLLHMQADDVASFNGTSAEGAWEVALPNGSYDVEVSVGDASVGFDPTTHVINVEGVSAISGFTTVPGTAPMGADRFRSATVQVTVNDGRLTIDAVGGTNTKINYLIIDAAAAP